MDALVSTKDAFFRKSERRFGKLSQSILLPGTSLNQSTGFLSHSPRVADLDKSEFLLHGG